MTNGSGEGFAEADGGINEVIAQCAMDEMTGVVIGVAIRGHLATALLKRPAFGGLDEGVANVLTTQVGIDVPGLEISDGTAGAAVGVGAEGDFGEPAKAAVFTRINQSDGGKAADGFPLEVIGDFAFERLHEVFGPERLAQAQPLVDLVGADGADGHGLPPLTGGI